MRIQALALDSEQEEIRIPSVIGQRYEVKSIFASGGFGIILEALDRHLARKPVLIKSIRYKNLFNHRYVQNRDETIESKRSSLEGEAKLLLHLEKRPKLAEPRGGLSHRPTALGICTCLDFVHDFSFEVYGPHSAEGKGWTEEELAKNEPYLVMQRVPGSNYHNYRGSQDFKSNRERRVLEMGKGIANTLEILHMPILWKQHVQYCVFQDIKPQNILHTEEGMDVLVDFGAFTVVKDGVTQRVSVGHGTRGYRAPEASIHSKVSRSSDIYSLGVTMYELLSEVNPSQEVQTDFGVLIPDTNQMDCTSATREIIVKAMAEKPKERYSSAHEMGKDILSALFTLGV